MGYHFPEEKEEENFDLGGPSSLWIKVDKDGQPNPRKGLVFVIAFPEKKELQFISKNKITVNRFEKEQMASLITNKLIPLQKIAEDTMDSLGYGMVNNSITENFLQQAFQGEE
jgi:hypothetical protein